MLSQTPSTPAADAPLAPGAELYGFRLHSATSVPEVRPMREPFSNSRPAAARRRPRWRGHPRPCTTPEHLDPNVRLGRLLNHRLVPDTVYAHESGGAPEAIPDLTYKACS